jgi:hypothetical protein
VAIQQETLRVCNLTITTALTGDTTSGVYAASIGRVESLTVEAIFTYGSGGTNATAYLQTSLDGGTTWIDIYAFQATTASMSRVVHLTAAAVTTPATPGDAALTANTVVNGILGALYRVKVTTTGTYAGGTTLAVWLTPK